MTETVVTILVFLGLFALLVQGVHIALSLLIVGFLGLWALAGIGTAAQSMPMITFSNLMQYVMVTVPMFVLMGNLIHHSKISDELYEAFEKLFGRMPGAHALATTAAVGVFAAPSGSSMACVATMGPVAIRQMERRGYSRRLAAGSIAVSGTLGVLLPPSVPMLIYAIATDESIAALFMAGFIPGFLSLAAFIVLILCWATWRPQDAPRGRRATIGEKIVSLKGLTGMIVLMIICMGTMYSGLATATESGAIGAFGALLIALRRRIPLKTIWMATTETAITSGMIFLIIIGTSYFATFLTFAQVPMNITQWLAGLGFSGSTLAVVFFLLLIPLGMFLDAIAILLICLPIMWPALHASGVNGIWFGIIMMKVLEIGQITPPVAINIFTMKAVAPHVPLKDIYLGSFIFLAVDMLTVVLLFAFPILSLCLPRYFNL